MNVGQLIEYLQTLPKDTEVTVMEQTGQVSYDGPIWEEVPLNLDPIEGNVDFVDFTENTLTQSENHPLHNRKFLTFGR